MTKKEKINLIELFRAGDLTALETLRKERERKKNDDQDFFSCFYYLADNGRISSKSENWDNPPIILSDFESLVREITQLSKDFDYSKLSDRALYNIVEIFESLKILEERNELHLLDHYKQKMT